MGCSSLDRNIWDGEKEIKTFVTKLAKKDISRLVSPVSGHLHSSIFFISALVRSYLTIPPVPQQGQRLTHPSGVLQTCYYVQIQTHFCYSHFFKINVNIKTPIQAEDCLYLNIFRPHHDTGEISDQYLCQINIYVIPMQWA